MGLPNKPNFEALLKSITPHQPNRPSQMESIIAIAASAGFDVNRPVKFSEHKLWYSLTENLDINVLISKIQGELRLKRHPHGREVALCVLCLYSLLPAIEGSYVQRFNALLNSMVPSDLTQVFILPVPPPPGYEFKFGSFTAGTLNSQRIGYRCRKAGSDCFERYESRIRGMLAYERDLVQVQVIDWIPYLDNLRSSTQAPALRSKCDYFIEVYFYRLARDLLEDFWATMLEEQHMIIALGSTYVDERSLQIIPDSFLISIFQNIGFGKYGFVAPGGSYTVMDLAGTNKAIPKNNFRLQQEFNFDSFGVSVLHQTMKSFVRFISRAKRHIWAERRDEGFLHFVIALDLLLTAGNKDNLANTVSKRASVLIHRICGRDFQAQAQKKLVAEIYDMRSKYVHEGKPVDDATRIELETVCEEILLCLLRLQLIKTNHGEHFYKQWLKEIDYVASAFEAGKVVSEIELLSLGVCSVAVAQYLKDLLLIN